MRQGMGYLRWSPEQFWNSTLAELHAGLQGYAEARGWTKPGASRRLADSDYDELLALAEAQMLLEGEQP